MMTVTRIYSDAAGDSRFETVSIPLHPAGMVGMLSEPVQTGNLIFREVSATYDWDFHPAPQRQYIVLLDGEIEIETSTGEKRIFRGGEILLVEDTSGKGHRTRNIQQHTRKSLFITLP